MKVAILMGTRPEALKNYSIVKALREKGIEHLVLHTNQHRDESMNAGIFAELGYQPDLVFDAPYHIGGAIDWVSKAIRAHHIDTLLVNGDTAAALIGAIAALNELAAGLDAAIFPVHPRTRNAMAAFGLRDSDYPRISMVAPMLAMDALGYIRHASVVITDSGCMQEEAAIMGVPCVTVRENTERPETVEAGANIVSGFAPAAIAAAVRTQIAKAGKLAFPPVYGTPGAGRRIVDTLVDVSTPSARAVGVSCAGAALH